MKFTAILKYFVLWQAAIIIMAIAAQYSSLPLRETYLGSGTQGYMEKPWFYSRENFDGMHYTYIARRGYGYSQQAFFPLYPAIMRRIMTLPILNNAVLAGILVSVVSFLAGLYLFTKLALLDYSPTVIKWTVLALLFFPTSFFFTSIYTEGLFFFLTIAAFYSARTRRWLLAGIFGALASYTRFIGIFLLPALLIEWWQQGRRFRHFLPLLLIPLGLGIYMNYLNKTVGDPLAFFHVQVNFAQLRSEKLILLYQVFWRYVKMLFTVNRSDPLYLTIILELVTGVAFLATTVYSFIKHRLSYAVFNFLAYLTPTLTGSFTSLPRYVLLCFPSFLLIGELSSRSPLARKIIFGTFALAFIIFLSLFARGYWVS
ncbi:MAG: mannosyltransferase family protein [Patescibacteria group bacterium]